MSIFAEIEIKWNGQTFKISNLLQSQTVNDLKAELYKLTEVLPERQKILGLKTQTGANASDHTILDEIKLKPGTKLIMMGSKETTISDVNKKPENLPVVVDDLDVEPDEIAVQNREENLAKISRRLTDYKIKVLNEPRPNKKLLVLDIDYTLFDHVSHAEKASELMRPYLHEFLTSAYEDFDIVIWSATSYKWIEVKMNELGVSKHTDYKIVFYLDCAAMISVYIQEHGLLDCKPLKVIWDKYPDFYSSRNTIMFDDIRRNFLMNPQNGLKILPFKNAHSNRETDRELYKLSLYLKKIARLDDLSELKHKHWDRHID
jgi:ubiquitin-like domain-containing CTD phosphatase 1